MTSEQDLEEIENEIADQEEEQTYSDAEARAEINQELAEDYGSPIPEERINQFKITSDAIKSRDNIKTTFLTKGELGKPLFSVRFYLDCFSISKSFNSPLLQRYFASKIKNITSSGMSNEGFIMKLNVTNRRDVTRRKEIDKPKNPEAP